MTRQLTTVAAFEQFIQAHPMAAVYFSGPACGVCTTLQPKLMGLFAERFPALAVAQVDCGQHQAVAAQQGVFTVPTLLIFFEGREAIRKARAFSPTEIEMELERPYGIFCDAPEP